MSVDDPKTAQRELRRLGYHRTASYRYPFRQLLPAEEQDSRTREYRSDEFMPGARFEDSIKLTDFDARLRSVVLDGILDFEVRVRTAIAHVLASKNPKAHLDESYLDEVACNGMDSQGRTKFEAWLSTYNSAVRSHNQDDFVVHHRLKYNSPLPVWATVEILSFGSLPHLLELMKMEDRNHVARKFGVRSGTKHSAWIHSIVDLRNVCAHGQRLFNASMKRPISVPGSAHFGEGLKHLSDLSQPDEMQRRKLYWVAAVLAYMLRSHEAPTNWHLTFKTQVRKLPKITLTKDAPLLVSCEANMGFPRNWEELWLWSTRDA